jgi:hypothetical protein
VHEQHLLPLHLHGPHLLPGTRHRPHTPSSFPTYISRWVSSGSSF